ncbi:MAG: hypothetical protein HY776_07240 [Actinobacteria bacterium]|nr:hypothetical protein [Actinomycetota bacterium]
MLYELLCQPERKIVLCHTTDLRTIKPLEGTVTPPIYIVHFQCPKDKLYSVNLCSSGHLDLINYADSRLRLLSEPLRQEFLELLIERLMKYEELTLEDFLREIEEGK